MDPNKINCIGDLARAVGANEDTGGFLAIVSSISSRIYKDTSCGAWVAAYPQEPVGSYEYHAEQAKKHADSTYGIWMENPWDHWQPTGVSVGSIVEGVERCTDVYVLEFPFAISDFWDSLETVAQEVNSIFMETHGCLHEECGDQNDCPHCYENPEDGMRYVHPDCPHCKGEGVVM